MRNRAEVNEEIIGKLQEAYNQSIMETRKVLMDNKQSGGIPAEYFISKGKEDGLLNALMEKRLSGDIDSINALVDEINRLVPIIKSYEGKIGNSTKTGATVYKKFKDFLQAIESTVTITPDAHSETSVNIKFSTRDTVGGKVIAFTWRSFRDTTPDLKRKTLGDIVSARKKSNSILLSMRELKSSLDKLRSIATYNEMLLEYSYNDGSFNL